MLKQVRYYHAITLDGQSNDFIEETDISALKEFSYRYYSHTLPKTHGNPTETTITSKKLNPWPIIGGSVGLILII